MLTVFFEDDGQDFLEWDINDTGEVVDCRPFQSWLWIGTKVHDSEAKHWLLCDLESREVYVGERELVRSFLNEEAKKLLPEIPVVELSVEQLKEHYAKTFGAICEELKRLPTPSIQEIEEKMRRDQEAVENMVKELG